MTPNQIISCVLAKKFINWKTLELVLIKLSLIYEMSKVKDYVHFSLKTM